MMDNLQKMVDGDPFDPNNWVEDDYEQRIYSDESLELFAVVDWIDYIHLCRFKWSVHSRNQRQGLKRAQLYLRRSVNVTIEPEGSNYICPISGKVLRNRHRIQSNLFLHQEVMLRTGIEPPDDEHILVDHINRNSMNCRRSNLHWATSKHNGNNRDKHGRWPRIIDDTVETHGLV